MPTITTTDLTLCADCAITYANGIDEHDADQIAHVRNMIAFTPTMTGHVAVGEIITDFSARQCDTCGTTDAGTRFDGALLEQA